MDGMKEPSDKRKRSLALHERAIRFSTNVNACCPECPMTLPSRRVWDQLVRAADSTSNNLIEADGASGAGPISRQDGIALREAKELLAGSFSTSAILMVEEVAASSLMPKAVNSARSLPR